MPIPILQYGVKVRDPTTKQFSDLAALRGAKGTAGPGVPAGGTNGDVLVKDGATDYAAKWTNTPKLMENLATIEPTSTVTQKTQYVQGEYLVYNGQLYKVTASTITQGQTLTPGGNIVEVDDGGLNDLNTAIANKTACKRINVTSTSEYIVSIGGILCGDVLFVDAVISKNLPSGSYQTLAISLPNSTEGRDIIYPTNYTGSPQSSQPTGSFSFGSASDRNIIGSCRISNTTIAICTSAAANADFFVSFCVAYLKNAV